MNAANASSEAQEVDPCPQCGFVSPLNSKFCGACGTPLPPTSAPDAATEVPSPTTDLGPDATALSAEPAISSRPSPPPRAPEPVEPEGSPDVDDDLLMLSDPGNPGAAATVADRSLPLAVPIASPVPNPPPLGAISPPSLDARLTAPKASGPRGAFAGALGQLASAISSHLPGEHVIARVMVPAVCLTVLVSLLGRTAAATAATVWAVAFVLAVVTRLGAKRDDGSAVAAGYWSVLGFVCAAPADAAAAVAAAFILWTSARPGAEWLPWAELYRKLARRQRAAVTRIATTPAYVILCAVTAAVVVLWLIPDVDKGFWWFAAFGLIGLLVLTLTTAGEVVPSTKAAGRLALVSGSLALASISNLRIALVLGAVLLCPVFWALKPRASAGGATS